MVCNWRSKNGNYLEESWSVSFVPIQFHLFLFPAGWAVGIMAGAGATILDHEVTRGMEASCGRKTKWRNETPWKLGRAQLPTPACYMSQK